MLFNVMECIAVGQNEIGRRPRVLRHCDRLGYLGLGFWGVFWGVIRFSPGGGMQGAAGQGWWRPGR